MKLSSLASGIGFAELTYQVRQIESYNAHALEAFAVGTALYLALGWRWAWRSRVSAREENCNGAPDMNANLAVIADNLDYLLWGRLAEGQPGGVALTLLMAIGATLLALPGGIALAGLAWRYGGLVRRLLFLWAEIIRGIPLIFVIFWLWYLLPMLTGGDLPGAVTVTLALAWFTAASVMHSVLAGLQSLPKGQYEAALTQGFAPGQTLRLVLLPQALRNVQPSLVGDLYRPAEGHFAGVYRQRPRADHRGRPGQQPGADLSPGDLRLHRRGVLPAVLRSEPAGQPALYPPRDHQIRLTPRDGASADRYR
ncbi:glutamate transport membrane-spanning protein [Klebsiella pneumoniae subsp. pneumoniae]|uniref:Glutamate transport membrane-spanning protein n=6 Tax=Gammaproteobacteria TaxID=1236 RepID=A0A378A824_KLEPN|nr:glutamate transport membrane-spanning protein [Klebsiella pneumoniae subsp. pneumoniae]